MIREIEKDVLFLARRAKPASPEDISVGQDLKDTLHAHREGCVGMAANMIGIDKAVIAFFENEEKITVMYNPFILKQSGIYTAEEGCLSLGGSAQHQTVSKHKGPMAG